MSDLERTTKPVGSQESPSAAGCTRMRGRSGPRRGRVLVMDDDALVREAATASLQELGYAAEGAPDGLTAVALYEKALGTEASFDVVLVDLTVHGGLGGEATLRALREIDPRVKVVVASGYGNDPVVECYAEHGFSGALTKPYRLSELERLLSRLLAV